MGFVPQLPLRSALESLHWAGAARNLAMVLRLMGPGDEEFDSKICRGIALTTKAAIMASVLNGKLPKVQSAYVAERVVRGYRHAATNIYMKDGTEYVFDWWPTLNPRNPLISSRAEWRVAGRFMEYRAFKGLP
jgi:hypothetical protein